MLCVVGVLFVCDFSSTQQTHHIPSQHFTTHLEVDERDISAIKLSSSGQLALSALPGERLDFTVTRISPVAVSGEGRNAFEVEAEFDDRPAGLRPGLQGIAKIEAGAKPWAWIATHRIGDWLKLSLWRWTR